MKIAVTYDNGTVYQLFQRTEHVKLYDLRGGSIVSTMVLETIGCGGEKLAKFLADLGVSTLICGSISGVERAAVEAEGIILYGGVTGGADEAVQALVSGTLVFDPNVHLRKCGDEHGCGHTCTGEDCAHCQHED